MVCIVKADCNVTHNDKDYIHILMYDVSELCKKNIFIGNKQYLYSDLVRKIHKKIKLKSENIIYIPYSDTAFFCKGIFYNCNRGKPNIFSGFELLSISDYLNKKNTYISLQMDKMIQ